jgi:uncharacterized membrane protein
VTSYELWLFLHVVATILWIGGGFSGQVFGVLAKRSGDPAVSAAFGRNMSFMATWVFMPSSLVVLVTGVLLVEDDQSPWDWGEPFVVLGIVGWAAVVALAFGYVTREMGKVGARLAAEGPSPELASRMNTLILIGRLLILVLFVVVFMMVAKLGT